MAVQSILVRAGWRYLKTIGCGGFSKAYLYPVDVALNSDGPMAVLCRSTTCKIVINTYGEDFLSEFGSKGTEPGQLFWPTCLLFDGEGLLHVADEYTNRISVFTLEGELVSHWGTPGDGEGQLNGPSGMVFDGDGNLLVVDHRNNRVQKFTRDGRFLDAWGRPGTGEGEFNLPWGITLDHEGDVYIADWRNDRVQKFTPTGEFLASYGQSGSGNGQFNRPTGVAVDLDGDIYVADWLNNRVQVLGADGRFVNIFHGDATLSKRAMARLLNETERARARFMAEDPQTSKLFRSPISIRLDSEGRLFVVETSPMRIQVYQKEVYPSPVALEQDVSEEPMYLVIQ